MYSTLSSLSWHHTISLASFNCLFLLTASLAPTEISIMNIMQDIYKSYLIHQATDGQWRNEWVDQPEGHSSHLNALGKLDVNHSLRGKRKNHDVVERPCDMPRQFQFREHYYQEKPLQLCKWQYFNYISYIVGLWYQMAAPWILKICCSFTRCLKKLTHMCELWLRWYWNWHRCLPIKYGHITRGYGYGV